MGNPLLVGKFIDNFFIPVIDGIDDAIHFNSGFAFNHIVIFIKRTYTNYYLLVEIAIVCQDL